MKSQSLENIVNTHSLEICDYETLWEKMKHFTKTRNKQTIDEIWFTEHPPIYTLGINADHRHLLSPNNIPVLQIDRGGQVTYHGPGQLMIYPLINLKRSNLTVRQLITSLEQSVIDLICEYGIKAYCIPNAPGVYVNQNKIASIGLRISRGASYHGMALNIDTDLEPFTRINPCGFSGLKITNLREIGISLSHDLIKSRIKKNLLGYLGMREKQIH